MKCLVRLYCAHCTVLQECSLFQSKPEAGLKLQILLCVWYESETSPPAVGAKSPTLTSKQLPNQCFKDLELDPITAEYSVNLNLGKLIN